MFQQGLVVKFVQSLLIILPYPKTSGRDIAIKVSGDSMEDTIPDGAIIVVKKDVMVEVGEIGVFLTKWNRL